MAFWPSFCLSLLSFWPSGPSFWPSGPSFESSGLSCWPCGLSFWPSRPSVSHFGLLGCRFGLLGFNFGLWALSLATCSWCFWLPRGLPSGTEPLRHDKASTMEGKNCAYFWRRAPPRAPPCQVNSWQQRESHGCAVYRLRQKNMITLIAGARKNSGGGNLWACPKP